MQYYKQYGTRGLIVTQTNKPLIISLLGQARSGKDYTATELKTYFEFLGKSVELMHYASPMKRIISTIFDVSLFDLEMYKNEPESYTVAINNYRDIDSVTNFRRILQLFGNEAMKTEFGNNVWADLMNANITKSSADIIIIPDLRFLAETSVVQSDVTIRIINEAIIHEKSTHASETEMDGYRTTYTLNNTNYCLTKQYIADLANLILTNTKEA
jgi:hypothetical protein